MKNLIYLFILLFVFGCSENNITPDSDKSLDKSKYNRSVGFNPMQEFQLLESSYYTNDDIIYISIQDEFIFTRSRNFFVQIEYQSYSTIIYIGEIINIDFAITGNNNSLLNIRVYCQQGD